MEQENLLNSLIERGWYDCESFLDLKVCQNLLAELKTQSLKPAKIGKGNLEQFNGDIRNDSIKWLNENTASADLRVYFSEMDTLMRLLNRELFLGLKQFECHFAKYDQFGFYKKHIDQFSGNNERLISTILYLNTPASGGELRIYNKNNSDQVEIDIPPVTGRFVCFLSNQIYHEVLPTTSERYSIAGWLRTTIL